MKINYSILVVEDDEIDRMNISRAFKKANVLNTIYFSNDGIDGLERLRSGTIEPPVLVLLDINMPRMNGLEFLKELRKDPALYLTPVVMLTTSKDERDRIEAYKLAVSGYIVKPIEFSEFVTAMTTVGNYWTLSEFPK